MLSMQLSFAKGYHMQKPLMHKRNVTERDSGPEIPKYKAIFISEGPSFQNVPEWGILEHQSQAASQPDLNGIYIDIYIFSLLCCIPSIARVVQPFRVHVHGVFSFHAHFCKLLPIHLRKQTNFVFS